MSSMREMKETVFPTHVGMNRHGLREDVTQHSIPHACGDEPSVDELRTAFLQYSPRMWG